MNFSLGELKRLHRIVDIFIRERDWLNAFIGYSIIYDIREKLEQAIAILKAKEQANGKRN